MVCISYFVGVINNMRVRFSPSPLKNMAISKDPIKYAEFCEKRRQVMKKQWEDPEFREKALKRKGVKIGTRFQQKVRKRRKLKLIEKERTKKLKDKILNSKKFCLRCGKLMLPYKISDNPIKYVYMFRCKCYPKGYYTD